ncbi:hypothetical protein ROA7450_03385 [Roseovarius albus]|uniref:Uncharacterized protein n=1 Tax=Roseovarius albus TaxID=1247867 RepID=A0A1X6ZXI9_9RHOB|nr:hypothetical protein [Roseovarius albus]SLN64145.1 hypothetical protein ROA7450_03385 [Roseovarius albus]
MKEYGTPNGINQSAYEDTADWDRARWRWEFLRRKDETRGIFHLLAIEMFRDLYPEKPIPKDLTSHELCRRGLPLPISHAANFGYQRLPNPFLPFEGQDVTLNTTFEFRTIPLQYIVEIEMGRRSAMEIFHPTQIAIVFDPNKPIKPQVEGLEEYLEKHRHHSLPKDAARIHIEKWTTYLRLLDAREAGVSWRVCAEKILPEYSSARTPQTARDQFKQAKSLQHRL